MIPAPSRPINMRKLERAPCVSFIAHSLMGRPLRRRAVLKWLTFDSGSLSYSVCHPPTASHTARGSFNFPRRVPLTMCFKTFRGKWRHRSLSHCIGSDVSIQQSSSRKIKTFPGPEKWQTLQPPWLLQLSSLVAHLLLRFLRLAWKSLTLEHSFNHSTILSPCSLLIDLLPPFGWRLCKIHLDRLLFTTCTHHGDRHYFKQAVYFPPARHQNKTSILRKQTHTHKTLAPETSADCSSLRRDRVIQFHSAKPHPLKRITLLLLSFFLPST